MTTNDFGGKVAIVTGGGRGIGRATCVLLARDGARVLVTDINLEAARETLNLLPGDGAHIALQMDVTQRSAVESVIEAAKDTFGTPPSLLVNCAGIQDPAHFVDVTKEKLDAMVDINLKGTFIVSQVFTRALRNGTHEEREGRGAVVNIASMMVLIGFPMRSHYAASKGAIISLTKSSAAELACEGIRVNCVIPGLIDTPMSKGKNTRQVLKDATGIDAALERIGEPEEVAEVIAFLLSESSSYIVGACVEVNGGLKT